MDPVNPLRTVKPTFAPRGAFAPAEAQALDQAYPTASSIINQAVAFGLPWQTILAFIVQHGLPKMVEWLKEWLAQHGSGQSEGVPSS